MLSCLTSIMKINHLMKHKIISLFFYFSLLFIINSCSINQKSLSPINYSYDVEIHRDIYGVPHIYGKTDEDAAFGLAYAHAEDDYETIQDILLITRGQSASVYGVKNAPFDYLVGFLDVWQTVDNNYNTLSSKVKSICNSYADGINNFIEKNPKKLKGDLYPVTGKDIIAGFAFRTPLMFNLHFYIEKIMKNDKPNFTDLAASKSDFAMYASNVFAVSPKKSSDQSTRIAINSHQPWTGPVAWYEAHINSEEGWNIIGGLFPGSPVIFKGHTENIAWSHTVNNPDLVDVFELTMNPKDNSQYLFDGEWKKLITKDYPIKIKIFGPLSFTINKKLYWSIHGPVIKSNHGTYALKYSSQNMIGQIEQWYRMNKSNNISEFKSAMKMMQIPMFNTLYADKEGNIFYIYNALIPKRTPGYDWINILPGNSSKFIWNEYYDYNDLPQVTNPKSGYLQNCNSTPYKATTGLDNPKIVLPLESGIETFQTNRALRANELFGADEFITRKEFYDYKYDTYYSKDSGMYLALNNFLNDIKTSDQDLLEGVDVLKNWDLGNQKENRGAALAQLTFKLTFNIDKLNYNYDETFKRFKEAVKFLKKEYGRLDIPLGNLQILKRGDLELPLDGGPDVLRAIYTEMKNNKKITIGGDCFFQMVEWDKSGNLFAESIHQFGSATIDKTSPHFNDQSKLFSKMKMKPSIVNFEKLRPYIKTSYKP